MGRIFDCTPRREAISAVACAQGLALREKLGTVDVDRQIAVAGMEPDRFAQLSHRLEAEKRVALDAPTSLFAEQTREDVRNGVDIGRDVQTPPFQIIAGVHDDGEFFGWHYLAQAVHKFRASRATCQNDDHAALRTRSAARSFSESRPWRCRSAGTNSG